MLHMLQNLQHYVTSNTQMGLQKNNTPAEQLATHLVCPPGKSSDHQGVIGIGEPQDQDYPWGHLQHVHLLPREYQGIPCACYCLTSHQPKGTQHAVQEVAKTVDKLDVTLENHLQKPNGSKGARSK
jgi:hypothetical protein